MKPKAYASAYDLPVWLYWEGTRPTWIQQCHQTVIKHFPDVRILSREDFDRMRDVDRDLELDQLHVAQRADYIRAFLLAKFGGLWIDSDCVVIQPLGPVMDILQEYDFLAHRERASGYWANDFMGASRESKIASELYGRVCTRLRSRQEIGWTALGSSVLTETLKCEDAVWFEIKSERIQPICWSNPDPFFEVRDVAGHDKVLDRHAICYMLSNQTMQNRFDVMDLSRRLLLHGTFFSYLINESLHQDESGSWQESFRPTREELGAPQPAAERFGRMVKRCAEVGQESLSGPGSSLAATEELRQLLPVLLKDLRIRSVLDAPCGDFNWMRRAKLEIGSYVGIDVQVELVAANRKKFGGPHRDFVTLDITRQPLPSADLILCRDCLVHFSFADVFRALRNFKKTKSTYLLTTTFPNRTKNVNISTGDWRPINLLRPPFSFPQPLRVINEKCTEGGGEYFDKSLALWKLTDIQLDES